MQENIGRQEKTVEGKWKLWKLWKRVEEARQGLESNSTLQAANLLKYLDTP